MTAIEQPSAARGTSPDRGRIPAAYTDAVPATLLPDETLTQRPMPLPPARGPVSAAVLDALGGGSPVPALQAARQGLAATADVLADDDLQLALFCLYELHYGGFQGVDDDLEWSPELLAARAPLEQAFEAALREAVPGVPRPEPTAAAVARALFELTTSDGGPSLSRTVAQRATLEQVRELLVLKSIYTLKEADPHSFGIPRLTGRTKAALVEIQADEYGGGRPARMHSAIFARTMRAAGLDDAYGAYIEQVPAIVLASVNVMSLFGLHRRLRGAIAGHLAAYEMTSSIPNKLYGNGFRRLGFDADATWYFDEHVEADAVHEQIAAHDLAGGIVEAEPELLDDVLFGAATVLALDGVLGAQVLDAWDNGRSALRIPLP